MKEKGMYIAVLLVLSVTMMFSISPVNAATTVVSVINPENGNEFILPAGTPVNTTFVANITVTDVEDLHGWQLNLTWDPELIKIADESNISRPSDAIFGAAAMEGSKIIDPHQVFWTVLPGSGQPSFTGNGTLCQIIFTTVKNGTGAPTTCDIAFDLISPFPTALSDPIGLPITFDVQDGSYIIPEFMPTTLAVLFLIATLLTFIFRKKNWLKH